MKKKPARKSKSTKKINGRPTKYSPQFHPMLAEYLARSGMIDSEIADKIGVSESTLNLWKKKYKKFSESLKNGKEGIDDGVERALYSRAMGYEHAEDKIFCSEGEVITVPTIKHYPPDTTACIFLLKNRRPKKWRDRIEHTGEGGNPIDVNLGLDPELQSVVNTIIGRVTDAA